MEVNSLSPEDIPTEMCSDFRVGKEGELVREGQGLLQMVIGGTRCNSSCHICNEVSHTTQFYPQNL